MLASVILISFNLEADFLFYSCDIKKKMLYEEANLDSISP
jgi:hypothetical protein